MKKLKFKNMSVKNLTVLTVIVGALVVGVFVVSMFVNTSGSVTLKEYKEVSSSNWTTMSLKEFENSFGSKGKLNRELSKEMGDGYKVYEWKGKGGEGNVTISFYDSDGDGNLTPAYMSSSGIEK